MARSLSIETILQSVRCSPAGRYVYLNNAKSACTTIKHALWKHAVERQQVDAMPASRAQLHGPGIWAEPFDLDEQIDHGSLVFSVVRNPYVRLLSCYRNKILKKRSLARTRFCYQYGYADDAAISFRDFVQAVTSDPEKDDDQHWRLQADNILVGSVPIAHVGHLETMTETSELLASKIGVELAGNQSKSSGAGKHLDEYDDRTLELAYEKYEKDFALFGYSRNPEMTDPVDGPRTFLAYDRTQFDYVRAQFLGNARGSAKLMSLVVRDAADAAMLRVAAEHQVKAKLDAGPILARSLREFPNDEETRRLVLDTHVRNRAWDRVIDCAGGLARDYPFRPIYHLRLGQALARTKARGEALDALQHADRLAPNLPGVKTLLQELRQAS